MADSISNQSSRLGGAFRDENTIMVDVWGYLLVKYELKRVLDIGCGYGYALKWFADNGLCFVTGIEGWDNAVENNECKSSVVKHDFHTGPAPVDLPYDLAWSAEFLEHVDEQYLPNVLQTMRLARYACVTHATPGQAGFHHVNCQSDEYWIRKFAEYGFTFQEEETKVLRRTDRWKAAWGRRSLMFFTQV
jgi:SAM-dependent methyltransferase